MARAKGGLAIELDCRTNGWLAIEVLVGPSRRLAVKLRYSAHGRLAIEELVGTRRRLSDELAMRIVLRVVRRD